MKESDFIDQLIFALEYFKNHPNNKVFEELKLSREDFLTLADSVILDSDKYEFFTNDDLRNFSNDKEMIDNYEKILKDIKASLLTANIPQYLEQMVDDYSSYQQQKSDSTLTKLEEDLDKKRQIFRARAEILNQLTSSQDETEPFRGDQAEELRKLTQQPTKLRAAVARQVEQKTTVPLTFASKVAETYTSYLTNSPIGQAIAKINKEKVQINNQPGKPVLLSQILNISDEIEKVASVAAIPLVAALPTNRQSLKDQAMTRPDQLKRQVEQELSNQVELEASIQPVISKLASEYVSRISSLKTDDPIPVIDVGLVKIEIARGNNDITIGQVIKPETAQRDELRQLAANNSREFTNKIREGYLPNTVFSSAQEKSFEKIVEDYRTIIANTKPGEMTPTLNSNALKDSIDKGADISEVLITPVDETDFGDMTEIYRIAIQGKIAELETSSKLILPIFATIKPAETLGELLKQSHESNSVTETPAEGVWAGPVGRAYIELGIRETGKTDPIKETALRLKTQGINSKNFKLLRARAIDLNVSLEQLHLLENNLKDIDLSQISFLNYVKITRAGTISGIESTKIDALFANGQINPLAIAPQQNFFGNVFYSVGQKILGGRAKSFIDGSIKSGLQKAAMAGVEKGAAYLTGAGLTELGATLVSVVPIVGTVVGAVVGWVVGKTIGLVSSGLNKNWGKVLSGLGAVAGFLVGGPIGLLVGAGIGAGFAGVNWGKIGKWAKWGIGIIATYLLARTLLPLILTLFVLIGGTIIVSLILFIINSGAYIVPPSTGLNISGQVNPGIVASGTCPVVGNVTIGSGSYNPDTETGHGGNSYWGVNAAACSYSIPIPIMYPGCKGPSISSKNVCSNQDQTCPYYGYAADVHDIPAGQSPGADVALPFLCDKGQNPCPSLTWTLKESLFNCGGQVGDPGTCTNPWGYLGVFSATGNGHTWLINLDHVDFAVPLNVGETYPSGTVVGKRSQNTNHVHIELDIDGIPVKPEFLCSG
ncbi:hypothetical protein BH10PAT1_BH10PAT1_5660 [soil metagenome]